MKRTVSFLTFTISVIFSMTAIAQEFRLNGIYVKPGQDDVWDNAGGAEISGTLWLNKYFGILGSVGVQNWLSNEDKKTSEYYTGKYFSGRIGKYVARNLPVYHKDWFEDEGSATIVPVGISGVGNIPIATAWSILLEAGVKYLFVNSNINRNWTDQSYPVYQGQVVGYFPARNGESEVELDDAIIGLVAGDIKFNINEQVAVNIGCGYQFDLSKSKNELEGWVQGSNENIEFQGFFARFGGSVTF